MQTLTDAQAEIVKRFEALTEESQYMTDTYRNDLPEYHELRKQIDTTTDEAEAAGIDIGVLFNAQAKAAARAYQRSH